jgi:hypothetical protein
MTAGEVRVPRARLLVAAAGAVVAAVLLGATRGYTFYFDEWTFISSMPDWTLASYFVPHNEHPAILFRALYSALMHTVGLRAYWPYMTVLLLAHAANALLLFEVIRRRAGDLIGFAAALLILVLGAGWEDLLWAFQMAWLLSIGLGLGALLVLESHRGIVPAVLLLTASLAFSGIGLIFAVAAGVYLLLTPARRREILWLVPLGAALVVWVAVFGQYVHHPNPGPTATNIPLAPLYAAWGIGEGLAGIVGEGGWFGPPLLVAGAAAVAWRWRRHGVDPLAAGIGAGMVAFYLVLGLTRAQLGLEQGGASRYEYVGAVLWLVLLGSAAPGLPWRGTWRPALVACLFLACFSSAVLFYSFAIARPVVMERQVADYYALAAERSDPCLDPGAAVDLLVMPSITRPELYYRAVDAFGDPGSGLPLRDQASYQAGLRNLRKAGC